MDRRSFVKTACACTVCAAAGCLSATPPEADETRHVFAESTLTVRIENRSDTDHDVERNARESLEFWEEHSREYVDFEVVEEDPDIVIRYADDPSGCEDVEGYSERVLGCAPLIRPGRSVRRPVTAHVVAGHRPFGKIRITTKHELGHIFGLGHDDEPAWIMSNRPADRIPLYDERVTIWERVNEAQAQGTAGAELFSDGVQQWQAGSYQQAEPVFLDSHSAYREMRELFADVHERTQQFDGHPRVETVNLPRLRDLLNRLSRRASAAEWFAWHMAEASRGVLADDDTVVETALSETNSRIREYNDIGPTQIRDVAIALGLVRGFDRDDEVLEETTEERLDENSAFEAD